jgi:Ca2+-binding EF-hand superfamily protein
MRSRQARRARGGARRFRCAPGGPSALAALALLALYGAAALAATGAPAVAAGQSAGQAAKPAVQSPPAPKPGAQKPGAPKPGAQKPGGQKPGTAKPGTPQPPAEAPAPAQPPLEPEPAVEPAPEAPASQPPADPGPSADAETPPAAADSTRSAAAEPYDERAAWHAQLESQYFEAADYDGGGWISFQESELALSLDREGFRAYDTDGDGRVDREEFGRRYRDAVERTGVFRPPNTSLGTSLPPKRTTEQLLAAYDRDASGVLEPAEVEQLAAEYEFGFADRAELMGRLDRDASGALELAELPAVVDWIHTVMYPGLQIDARAPAKSLEELLGKRELRPAAFGVMAQPALAAGPLPMFARLDADADGALSAADFAALQLQVQMGVRAGTVLAALDGDGDGRISRSEFRSALERPRP